MGAMPAGFIIVGAVIIVGYLAGRLSIGGPAAGQTLTHVAFFVTNPALLFTVLAEADLSRVISAYVPIALIASLATALIFALACRIWFRRSAGETAIGAMSSSFVNANNLGIPIAVYVLGSAAPVAPILLVQLLVLAPLYLSILDLTSGGKPSIKRMLTQPIRNPMIIASCLGILSALLEVEIQQLLWEPLTILGGAAVPLVLMAFGMSLRGSSPLKEPYTRVDTIAAVALKSFAMPVLTWLLAQYAFHAEPQVVFEAVVMASLPTAQNVFMFASRYNRAITVARDTALVSSALSIPVLVAVSWLLAT